MIQSTSLEAFKVLEPELGNLQRVVYDTICEHNGMSNHDISRFLHWEINRVTPRVKELRDMGLIVCSHVRLDKVTGRNVMCWKSLNGKI
jgi:DNA-binding MarR family transcriptional regulator